MLTSHIAMARDALALGALILGLAAPAGLSFAEEAAHPVEAARAAPATNKLPGVSTTDQSIEIGGRVLHFKATLGALPVKDPHSGDVQAEVAYRAYSVEPEAGRACRPVAFIFNGGPGSGSAWLDLGALGPWRLALAGAVPSTPPLVQDNQESWLDFADLVFIDPPGTGFSRLASGEAARKRLWAVDGDIDMLARLIRQWTQQAKKLDCPKYLVGESYGGFRAPKVARALQEQENIGVDGLILISPVLDFSWIEGRNSPLVEAARLPSLAASHAAAKDRAALAGAENYARGEYLADVLRGPRDAAALERLTEKVSKLTGLPAEKVRRLNGRIGMEDWAYESDPSGKTLASLYDGQARGASAEPGRKPGEWSDPVLDAARAPLASAMASLTIGRLKWSVEDAPYEILNDHVSQSWDWQRGRRGQEATSDLRRALALDPRVKVLVAQGLYDLVTPYFAMVLQLDLLPTIGAPDRIAFLAEPGGHMFYAQDASRAALRDAARKLIKGE